MASPPASSSATASVAQTTTAAPAPPKPKPKPKPPFAVGVRVVTFTDPSRTVTYPGQAPQPRQLVTTIRYPARGASSQTDVNNAPPRRAGGPFPLVIFGHGFAVTPGIYATLLQAWARAGYVVAAPAFPLGNKNAPGGPNENDLVNQPGDMSFLISQLLEADGIHDGFFGGLIDPHKIAVSGQSDGGDTALSVAYDSQFLDRRIGAAMILSGQEIPGVGGYTFPAPSPPLLAVQGTADTINLPATTYAFFNAAQAPKYLLALPGARHLPPYTDEQPQLSIVERVTVAFMDRYLKGDRRALGRMATAGNVAGTATLQSDR